MIIFFGRLLSVGLVLNLLGHLPLNGQEPATNPAASAKQTSDQAAVESSTSGPPLFESDFENGLEQWELKDDGWKLDGQVGQRPLSQFRKESNYEPQFRSPLHQAILKAPVVTDFQLDVRVLSTHPDYEHRDACLFFGYQNANQFYYVHFGKVADPHANQIFIVNKSDRTKISATTTKGTPWDDRWHQVRLVRHVESGKIEVFFDDLKNPVMTAIDKTFASGRVGLGSFDDTADWDDFKLSGLVLAPDDSASNK